MNDPGVDLGNGITATCDGYVIWLTQWVIDNGMSPDNHEWSIILAPPHLHALIAFARERGLLEG